MFNKDIFKIDCQKEAERVQQFINEQVFSNFKNRGAVVGLSGGIDSAVVSALCVNALGKDKVLGLILPEKDSNPISSRYARKHAQLLDIPIIEIDITNQLETLGVYEDRINIINKLFPHFDETYTFNVTLPQNLLEKDRINYHTITIKAPNNQTENKRLPSKDWLGIASLQNVKQRIRMVNLYKHAERNNYLVAGTTNKSEVLQGFFVKYGDGGVDIEPIAHLFKTEVYQLAHYLGVTKEIIARPPSPDTYSLPVTDEEFYFCMPYELVDLLLYAYENHTPQSEIADILKLTQDQIKRIFRDFKAKENSTWHSREMPPTLQSS